jgi:hypothetical protein
MILEKELNVAISRTNGKNMSQNSGDLRRVKSCRSMGKEVDCAEPCIRPGGVAGMKNAGRAIVEAWPFPLFMLSHGIW